ncbi:hypothetical protein H5410_057381 [Solanum commersonii]|uniref:Uncharacterized protein n=1 Tax=Solanum commersonii TaxID=4109 RepID=A0A9J5WPW8_SOLCO|nr:hypothetical protein H5410_057381 [Solanum commersonii]
MCQKWLNLIEILKTMKALNEIKKVGKEVDFKRKRIFLEYDLQIQLMERITCSVTIKELSKVVKLDRNFEDNGSLKVVLPTKISMEIAYYKIIDLVDKLGETS